jgi:nucleoside-diphosphate-sugar epimerase
MQSLLITGGNGFLASNIIKSLVGKFKIIVVEKNCSKLPNLEAIRNKLIIYDIDQVALEQIFDRHPIDIILHAATVYGRNNETPEILLATNLLFPFKLLQLGIANKTKLFINVDTVLERNTSPYSLTKAQFKEWLKMYAKDLKVVNMQLEHFYGPGGSSDNFISLMIRSMLQNQSEINLTKGEQKRDFIYYSDVVDAFGLVIDSVDSFQDSFVNFVVSSGETITIKSMVETIKKITKSTSVLKFGALPYRENELMESITSNAAMKELGWSPKVTIEQGLEATINSIKN